MKRSRSIELVLMGTMPLLLSACGDGSAQQPQNTFAYQNLQQCINEGKVSADICEKAYADAVQAQYRDGPRYNTLGECQAQFGDDEAAPFVAAVAAARDDLKGAFTIRQRLDDATREDAPTRRQMLTVTDDGPGVDPAVASTLFEPFSRGPLSSSVAAVSVGVVDGRVRLDLPYEEDSRAEVDMNVVATDTGTLVELQGTGESATFARSTLDQMLDVALKGCQELTVLQATALAQPYPGELPRS